MRFFSPVYSGLIGRRWQKTPDDHSAGEEKGLYPEESRESRAAESPEHGEPAFAFLKSGYDPPSTWGWDGFPRLVVQRPGVPHLHRLVLTGGGEAVAVGADRRAPDPAGMPLEGEGFLAGRGIPNLHCLVLTGRGEAVAVGAERHALDISGMPLEGADFLAGVGVPHLHRAVIAGGGEPLAVRAVCHRLVIPLERTEFPPGRGVPHL